METKRFSNPRLSQVYDASTDSSLMTEHVSGPKDNVFIQGTDMDELVARVNGQIEGVWFIIGVLAMCSMQVGLLMLEVGLVRKKNARVTAVKILTNHFVVAIFFWAIGYGISTGSNGGIIGEGVNFDFNFDDVNY